ncbi:MAG TPA: hypothetical protein VJ983_01610 [candidate division Zixibacteria bacterium]|nr:hypothetical protein [candidate division Zixibacteria bacterium]
MNINPVGIQSYQQINVREDNQTQKSQDSAAQAQAVSIEPQDLAPSKVAVKASSGSYAQYLSPEEKNALDLLFARFQNADRFGPGYTENDPSAETGPLGKLIDVKV